MKSGIAAAPYKARSKRGRKPKMMAGGAMAPAPRASKPFPKANAFAQLRDQMQAHARNTGSRPPAAKGAPSGGARQYFARKREKDSIA